MRRDHRDVAVEGGRRNTVPAVRGRNGIETGRTASIVGSERIGPPYLSLQLL